MYGCKMNIKFSTCRSSVYSFIRYVKKKKKTLQKFMRAGCSCSLSVTLTRKETGHLLIGWGG